ncbi:MAG: cytochrome c [Pirellulaceae bacterium]|nr:cytochrome c [Pirellulaceae bacterium]
MSSQSISTSGQVRSEQASRRLPPIPPLGAVLLIGWLFGFLILMQAAWIVATASGTRVANAAAGRAMEMADHSTSIGVGNSAWIWLSCVFVLLLFVLLQLHWGSARLQRLDLTAGLTHFGMLLCGGLLAFGVQLVLLASLMTEQPIVLDYSQRVVTANKSAANGAIASASSLVGDPANGRKVFVMSCVTCHGATGDGLSNLAPSLRTSEFVKSSDLSAIERVIALGRALTDPANKSGKVMPAKGGNPFLKDQEIADLAAFVASIPNVADSPGPATSNSPVLAKWVVPAATAPPVGLAETAITGPAPVSLADALATQSETAGPAIGPERRSLRFMAVAVHATLLAALFLIMARSLFGWLLGMQSLSLRSWFYLASWGWWLATATWLLLVSVCWW